MAQERIFLFETLVLESGVDEESYINDRTLICPENAIAMGCSEMVEVVE